MPESSIEAAVAAAEQDGLRFLLRVRLAVLAAVAVWMVTGYAALRLVLGLAAVVVLALLSVAQYELGRRYTSSGPTSPRRRTAMARCTTLSSSRTFPGQGSASSTASASRVNLIQEHGAAIRPGAEPPPSSRRHR